MFECILYGTSKNKLRNKFYAVGSERNKIQDEETRDSIFCQEKKRFDI